LAARLANARDFRMAGTAHYLGVFARLGGNYINTFDIRMPRADSLVWLDHPRGICMRRVLMRTIMGYGRTRSDLAEGCPDRFDIAFLSYVWNFPIKQRPRIIGGIAQFGGHLQVVQLGSDR
jgi:hypothetical protein